MPKSSPSQEDLDLGLEGVGLNPKIGHNIGLQAPEAPEQRAHLVENITRRVWGDRTGRKKWSKTMSKLPYREGEEGLKRHI